MSPREKLTAQGAKKLLALDGGGIRGLITLEVLAEIERLLRERLGRNERFVLADYFDYIAGTSTGAIIAAALSLGWPVARIRMFYEEKGEELFDKVFLLTRFRYKYEDDKLTATLKREFGEGTTLGSPELKTLLMVVMRNATTDSPWPVSNNPRAKYNDLARDDCNLNIPLWQLVRASTAAPVYFPPEVRAWKTSQVRLNERSDVYLGCGMANLGIGLCFDPEAGRRREGQARSAHRLRGSIGAITATLDWSSSAASSSVTPARSDPSTVAIRYRTFHSR